MDPAAQRIRDKLWYGILPNVKPLKTRGGHGTYTSCATVAT
jgi:hypothetical protein